MKTEARGEGEEPSEQHLNPSSEERRPRERGCAVVKPAGCLEEEEHGGAGKPSIAMKKF